MALIDATRIARTPPERLRSVVAHDVSPELSPNRLVRVPAGFHSVSEPLRVRPPAVAGSFYPADAAQLRREVDAYIAEGTPHPTPKAIVVPHAGYRYSGSIAGSAYASLIGAEQIRRVVLLGPSHHVRVQGLALPDADAMQTPLGLVRVDAAGVAEARRLAQVHEDGVPHAREHSLEVQLPFLQRTLKDFSVVPFSVGGAHPDAVAEVLDKLWGGPETLIMISSDLSHYLPYEEGARMDLETAKRVARLDPSLDIARACGAVPLNGLLRTAKARGMRAELWDLRSSGDTAGPRDSVVGYSAFGFYEK
jgi:AmmeMemoRadiSam system protein B